MRLKVLPFLVTVVILSGDVITSEYQYENMWAYACEGAGTDVPRCVKHHKDSSDVALESELMPLNQCKLTCSANGQVWPMPTGSMSFGKQVSRFTFSNVKKKPTSAPDSIVSDIEASFASFLQHIEMYHPDYDFNLESANWITPSDSLTAMHELLVSVIVEDDQKHLTLDTDESYNLSVTSGSDSTIAVVEAKTFFGARHGLETLSQLMNFDEENGCLQIINDVSIGNDAPRFPYRGLIIDTSRNFIPVTDIKRTIKAMASNKLNTFHWHISDTNSMPIVLESLPLMTHYGAHSADKIYRSSEVLEIIEYGRQRGVRVMPEIDTPAHVGNGWQWGPEAGLGDLAVCVNQEPWASYCVQPPCGQLNIANENIYAVLGDVYQELVKLFANLDMYHFGGDEISLDCWNTTNGIVEWMKTVGDESLTDDAYYQQWSIFQNKSHGKFMEANGKEIPGILWTSHLTEQGRADKYLDKDKYIIQIWTNADDPLIAELMEKEFRVIFSNSDAWYFDCGFGAWVGEGNNWCSPYKGWQIAYDNSPEDMAGSQNYSLILGGEGALWMEQTGGDTMDAKLWPRAAAMAERLWTNPSSSWRDAEYRMIHHRQRMVARGIQAEGLQPEWCYQNAGLCYHDAETSQTTTTECSGSISLIPSCILICSIGIYRVLKDLCVW